MIEIETIPLQSIWKVQYNIVDYPNVTREHLGLIPEFVMEAAHAQQWPSDTLELIAAAMDSLYGYGGFAFPFTGKIEDDGSYIADNDEDPPLAPYAKLEKCGLVCWIYPYAIVGLVDSEGNQKIGRFD